jgi:hypothetical protein
VGLKEPTDLAPHTLELVAQGRQERRGTLADLTIACCTFQVATAAVERAGTDARRRAFERVSGAGERRSILVL